MTERKKGKETEQRNIKKSTHTSMGTRQENVLDHQANNGGRRISSLYE